MMNQDNPYAMNQTCKVCGEPAAGFHFGAFTCEGCKSFFGRSYNNLSSISDCKNNGECIINKKNRTACKACRLRKCLLVGMSKSGSRYGRRSNWFKIHCLLQEQQQQAAAAMAAHHNNQQQAAAAAAAAASQHGSHGGVHGQKQPPPPGSSQSAAAAAALGMLGHAGAYPSGFYPPRTKEELMMLGLEEYAKHPAASPSVSSPDSHNSDSSVEVNVRGNQLLHLAGKHEGASAGNAPQMRKDLPHFLPLPFAGLASMPVMPPPAFLPPSHLLFPGYHPALYQHHQGLLKPSPEQQQAVAAAAAVQHLFNTSNAAPNRFTPSLSAVTAASSPLTPHAHEKPASPKSDALNNNHIPNGSKAAEELTKRFYLDAVLKSQRSSPPPSATKLPAVHSKHDHSISALVTPNSESGRERLKSRQSPDEEVATADKRNSEDAHSNDNESDCGEDLVVSMTPPRSPANQRVAVDITAKPTIAPTIAQDDPIDLSMRNGSSLASSLSSKCSSTAGSVQAERSDSENENEHETETDMKSTKVIEEASDEDEQLEVDDGEELQGDNDNAVLSLKGIMASSKACNLNNNNSCSSMKLDSSDSEESSHKAEGIKRKLNSLATKAEAELTLSAENIKRAKLQVAETVEKTGIKLTTPLDLTTKV